MSTPQAQTAPQALQATATHAPAPASPAPVPRSFSRPTTANANAPNAQDSISHAPGASATAATAATAANPTAALATAPSTANAQEEPLSFNDKLNAGDRYWKFKFALMAILIITGLIGIGCFAWLMTTMPTDEDFSYTYTGYWSLWPALIPWSISILWCFVCIGVFVARKRTVHPGVRVSMDLLLWLGFIVSALFATASLLDLMDYGTYGGLDGYSYYGSYTGSNGDYVLASNNTWVWEQDTSYVTSPRTCEETISAYSNTGFDSCEEQDAYVNKLWHEKPHRVNVELTGVVCQYFGLLLHFALFVWACVDTHYYNRSKTSKDAEKLAAGIVQTMIRNGAVVPPPGQAYMRPPMGQGMYYQLAPQQQQGYPMQNMYPQQWQGQPQQQQMAPGQYPMGQQGMSGPTVGAAGPSNEKGQGPRYA